LCVDSERQNVSTNKRGASRILLRTRNFGLFWTGESISAFGSAITTVAIPLLAVSVLHASATVVALLTAATWLPWLLIGLPAGAWVDRWPRRRVLIISDLASATVLIAVTVAAWCGVLDGPMLLGASLVLGASSVFFTLAFNAYFPQLLKVDERLEGNSRLQASASTAQTIGPGVGGLLAQTAGAACGLIVDSFTFLISAACLLAVRTEPESKIARPRSKLTTDIAEGLSYFRHDSFLLPMLAVAATINFALLGVSALRVVFLVRTVGLSPELVGALVGIGSFGAIVAATLTTRIVRHFGSARTYITTTIGTAPFMLLLPASNSGWRLLLFPVGAFVVSAGATITGIITVTFRSHYIPEEALGRVTAATRFVVSGSIPLGATVAGLLARSFGTRNAMWALSAVFAIAPLPLLFTPLRSMRDFPSGHLTQPTPGQ
jgi:MFS family permease